MALSSVTVLDLTWYVAGPYCTKLLADYGARVIKIERPGIGDPARRIGPSAQQGGQGDASCLFLHLNTNKLGVSLDLRHEAGRALFTEMVRRADVLVESFAPRTMPALGFSYEALAAINPRLVVTSISNFGQDGPYRDYAATEIVLYAMGLWMAMMGEPGREPLKAPGRQAQYQAGIQGAAASLCALYGARLTARGQNVDVSIMEAMVGIAQTRILPYAYSGDVSRRTGNRISLQYYPGSVYPCQDGYVGAYSHEFSWPRLCQLMGFPELADDPEYRTAGDRHRHADQLDALLMSWMADRSKSEIFHSAQRDGIPFAPVNDIGEVVRDPHHRQRGCFPEIEDSELGRIRYPGAPFQMSETPWATRRPAPTLGQHNEEVYRGWLGHSAADLERLREKGVV